MSDLWPAIKTAVRDDRYVVSMHAERRCQMRRIESWQLVIGIEDATVEAIRPRTRPFPSVVVKNLLADGSEVTAVWSWIKSRGIAKLVTVYFGDDDA
jgi:hypothetical protein